jgi:hypothetical protein
VTAGKNLLQSYNRQVRKSTSGTLLTVRTRRNKQKRAKTLISLRLGASKNQSGAISGSNLGPSAKPSVKLELENNE